MTFRQRTLRALAAVTVALAAVGGLAGQAAHAATDCSADCISSVGATVAADDLTVGFWTTAQTTATFTVWTGLGFVAVGPMSQGPGYYHSFTVTNKLIPGTYYFYEIDAKDAYGHVHTEYYGFTTKNRIVTFTIDKIYVSNDSDALSAGEFWIGYKMGPVAVRLVSTQTKSVSSGQTWWFSATKTVYKAPQNFTVAVELDDDDGGCGAALATWNNGSSSCIDWATASRTFVIPSTPGQGDSGTVTFSVNSYVGFTVYGHYHWQVI